MQHIGMPFMVMQHMQPGIIMFIMQSHMHWIILQQAASPLVQVMTQPMSVISTLQAPVVMLQQQQVMPFIVQQQLIMALGIIIQRFCIIAADILSSAMQVTRMPSAIFSNFIVQRGIIIGFVPMPMFIMF